MGRCHSELANLPETGEKREEEDYQGEKLILINVHTTKAKKRVHNNYTKCRCFFSFLPLTSTGVETSLETIVS
jgi:hypothetical protein